MRSASRCSAAAVGFQAFAQAQAADDPVVRKIIELGTKDNRVMTWNDFASNRFGGRETGTHSYNDATAWAAWQFRQFGLDVALEEVGELPVGFNRGPWFGKMLKPAEKALRFATPSFTAGTKGIQRGPVVILKADPFSIPGRAQGGQPVPKDVVEKKRAAIQAAIAEVNANKAAFKGAWVLIPGASSGFARDGRRGSKLPDGSPEYLDAAMMPLLTKALVDAGALGTIQSATPPSAIQPDRNSEPPLSILDGFVASWDTLPVLPDIKLLNTQFSEIKALVEKGEPVVLEFDIRNWFTMGPIKYHNVVATLRGTTYPDEFIVIGGHFDAFTGGTGGVDDGSGFAPGMEAIRLIAASGAKPKRSIVFIAFAAEEQGLVGSQAWLKKHPELHGKIVMMINRDGSPSAITGAAVPESWYADFQKITAPLATLHPKWPFVLTRTVPRAHATSPGGTDSSSFEMQSIPTLNFATTGARPGPDGKEIPSYPYPYAWHTTNDLYSELVPYTEHQQHSALATAVVAYGVANLDKPLTRDGVYLADGIFATLTIGSGPGHQADYDDARLRQRAARDGELHPHRRGQGAAARRRPRRPARWHGRRGPGRPWRGGAADRPDSRDQGRPGGHADRVGRPEVGGHPEAAEDDEQGAQARRRRHHRSVGSEHLLSDAAEEGQSRREVRRDRESDLGRRSSAGAQEGRADPQHPHHARGSGRARLQDG